MPRLTYQTKSLPLQREFGRVALPSVRSNGPTDPLHIPYFTDDRSIFFFLNMLASTYRPHRPIQG
jgi:hypothetical protein